MHTPGVVTRPLLNGLVNKATRSTLPKRSYFNAPGLQYSVITINYSVITRDTDTTHTTVFTECSPQLYGLSMKIPMATASTPSLAPPSAAPLPAVIPLCSPTLPHEAMPPWFHAVASPSILRGYRATDQRLFFYVVSALYPHNESINIWSHLLGTCAFITLAIDNSDDVYLVLYCLAAAAFIISSFFICCSPLRRPCTHGFSA